jgi:hypothetical protein
MNRRSITLGVSVIALALAGPGQARAAVLDELGSRLPQTDVTVQAQANVKAKADVPLALPPKGSHRESATHTSVNAEGDAKGTGTGVRARLDGRADAGGGPLGARAGLEQNARVKGAARQNGADGELAAAGSGSARLGHLHHGRASAKAESRTRVRTTSHSLAKPSGSAPTGNGDTKDLVPLRGIGREVGNPIQLSLAGWLIALTGAACLGASRVVRRLQRSGL